MEYNMLKLYKFVHLPADIKNGILNFPEITTERSSCIVGPSNGNAPQTNTYKTTPRLYNYR